MASYQSWQRAPRSGYDASVFGGVIYTTVTDFYHWLYALLTGKVLSAAATARLLTPIHHLLPTTVPTAYQATRPWPPLRAMSSVLITAFASCGIGPVSVPETRSVYYPATKISLIILANLIDTQWFRSSQEPLIFS